MLARRLIVVLLLATLVIPAWPKYKIRLYFRNETRGTSNTGALIAGPGDKISVVLDWDLNQDTTKMGAVQIFLRTSTDGPISPTDAAMAAVQAKAFYRMWQNGPGNFFAFVPSDGPLFDDSTQSETDDLLEIAVQGIYIVLFIPESVHTEGSVFTFTIPQDTGPLRLKWGFEGRDTQTGVSTRMIDSQGKAVKITDNWLEIPGVSKSHVKGKINFTGLTDPTKAPTNVNLLIRNPSGGSYWEETTLTADGYFEADVETGLIGLGCQYEHWITTMIWYLTDSIVVPNIDLINGDAFRDDLVDIRDIDQCLLLFGQPSRRADLDADGVVNLYDLVTTLLNFGAVGAS